MATSKVFTQQQKKLRKPEKTQSGVQAWQVVTISTSSKNMRFRNNLNPLVHPRDFSFGAPWSGGTERFFILCHSQEFLTPAFC